MSKNTTKSLKTLYMGLLNNIFGDSGAGQSSKVAWIALESLEQLDELVSESHHRPALIFKHSTRCSISRMALKQFETGFDLHDKITPYFLDLIEYRTISNAVASKFGVQHQSPQVLLISNGISVYDASHSDIDVETVATKL